MCRGRQHPFPMMVLEFSQFGKGETDLESGLFGVFRILRMLEAWLWSFAMRKADVMQIESCVLLCIVSGGYRLFEG